MRIHNYLNNQLLKVMMSMGVLCFSFTVLYGQETMEDAVISISFSEENNTRTIISKAMDQSGLPIEDLELYIYAERTFGLLPIGDAINFTDDQGIIEIEFPGDLPGDTEGNVNLVIKLMESDTYNDLTLKRTVNWGVPITIEDPKDEKRSLWAAAANAPISLVLIVSLLIIAVWYVICFIIYKLFRISKIKPVSH